MKRSRTPSHSELVFTLLFSLLAGTLSARAEVVSQKHSYAKLDPKLTVTEFSLVEMKKRVRVGGTGPLHTNYLTDIRAVYKTQLPQQATDYGIVQFIRGCQWDSNLESGIVKNSFNVYRDHMGHYAPFIHPDWEVDTDSLDPIYSSDYRFKVQKFPRHALLRWNTNPNSLDAETAIFLVEDFPKVSRVFVTDLPGSAFLSAPTAARNTSLEFRTCLFKVTDLPPTTDKSGSNIDLSKALACLTWDHKYVYDYKQKTFNTTGPISPTCPK